MKIRLLSDIHQEFYEDKTLYKSQGEDVLVLAGDISVGVARVWYALRNFYEEQQNIIYVPGNHEYYGTSIAEFDYRIKSLARNTNISFLNPGAVKLDGVTFIGATLWTDFRADAIAKAIVPRNINDFSRIRGFDGNLCSILHDNHYKYIREAYSQYQGKKVIVTHFLPATECIAPEWRGEDLLNYYFANDHGRLIGDMQDTTWLFGHTHSLVDVTLGDTRLIANPYGYNQNHNYKEMIIEI